MTVLSPAELFDSLEVVRNDLEAAAKFATDKLLPEHVAIHLKWHPNDAGYIAPLMSAETIEKGATREHFSWSPSFDEAVKKLCVFLEVSGKHESSGILMELLPECLTSGLVERCQKMGRFQPAFQVPNKYLKALSACEVAIDAKSLTGRMLTKQNDHPKFGAASETESQNFLAKAVADRLNEADKEVLQAIIRLDATQQRPVTNAAIAKELPGKYLTADNMKQRTGPLWRHGILDKGISGAGFYLSEFGNLVAERAQSVVRTEERPGERTD